MSQDDSQTVTQMNIKQTQMNIKQGKGVHPRNRQNQPTNQMGHIQDSIHYKEGYMRSINRIYQGIKNRLVPLSMAILAVTLCVTLVAQEKAYAAATLTTTCDSENVGVVTVNNFQENSAEITYPKVLNNPQADSNVECSYEWDGNYPAKITIINRITGNPNSTPLLMELTPFPQNEDKLNGLPFI